MLVITRGYISRGCWAYAPVTHGMATMGWPAFNRSGGNTNLLEQHQTPQLRYEIKGKKRRKEGTVEFPSTAIAVLLGLRMIAQPTPIRIAELIGKEAGFGRRCGHP